MNQLLHVSSSPHIKDKVTTSSIMLDVVIALLPATFFGIYQFKINALLIILTTIITCVLSEYIYEYFMKKNDNNQRFISCCYRSYFSFKFTSNGSFMDTSDWWDFCNHCC